ERGERAFLQACEALAARELHRRRTLHPRAVELGLARRDLVVRSALELAEVELPKAVVDPHLEPARCGDRHRRVERAEARARVDRVALEAREPVGVTGA